MPILEDGLSEDDDEDTTTTVIEDDSSSTDNYVIVMDLKANKDGQISEKGRVRIGEPHESITAIRFFDDYAYVVTFERTDPFYVIGFADDGRPETLGEFKLNGFSSYLHPMTPDNKFLIGVGQNATDDGRETGFMVTVFDATVPEKPVAILSHAIDNEDGRYSSSSSQWEHKAFRYIGDKLILPLTENFQTKDERSGRITYDSFQGVVIFAVNTEEISESYRISHNTRSCNYCDGNLPPRSFVYDGNLMTLRGSIVSSTDLDTGKGLWTTDVVVDGEENECCPTIWYTY